jgi:hypothetical protein
MIDPPIVLGIVSAAGWEQHYEKGECEEKTNKFHRGLPGFLLSHQRAPINPSEKANKALTHPCGIGTTKPIVSYSCASPVRRRQTWKNAPKTKGALLHSANPLNGLKGELGGDPRKRRRLPKTLTRASTSL